MSSVSPSTSGTSPSASVRTSSTTSSRSTRPGAPRTPACAATRRSSSPRCWTRPSPSASTPCAPATTPPSSCARTAPASCTAPPTWRRTSPTSSACWTTGSWRTRCSRWATPSPPRPEIREEAARRGLFVAKKPDSHDICFIADGDTQGFLAKRLGAAEGDIVDESGNRLGTHEGAYGFTIGQRKGLRIGHPAADGKPRYVLDISPVDNTVTVGPVESLDVTALTAIRPRWCGRPPAAGPATYTAQLRAHGGETEVTAEVVDDTELRVTFTEPVRGVAPGQAIVLYDGSRVVGSATIATTERRVAAGVEVDPRPVSTCKAPWCRFRRRSGRRSAPAPRTPPPATPGSARRSAASRAGTCPLWG